MVLTFGHIIDLKFMNLSTAWIKIKKKFLIEREIEAKTLKHEKGKYELSHYNHVYIYKSILYRQTLENELIESLYDCQFDFPLKGILKVSENKFANIKITTTFVNSDLYGYATVIQRIYIKCYLKKFWFQKSSHIMWLVNVIIASIAAIAAIGAWYSNIRQ